MTLTACQSPVPEAVELPDVVWESDGTSPLETDEFVVAARAADLGLIFAWNTANFRLPEFTTTNSPSVVDRFADGFVNTFVTHDGDPTVYPGPSIWQPISVETDGAGAAVVVVCEVTRGWVIRAGEEPSFDLESGTELTIELEPGDDGIVVSNSTGSTKACDATGAPIGRFDPVPVPPESITADDVILP